MADSNDGMNGQNHDESKNTNYLNWNAMAVWSRRAVSGIHKDTCAICRSHVKDLCIDCQAEKGTHVKALYEMCPEATGACSHVFHLHCISRWLKNHWVCPLDYRTWDFNKCGKENQKS